MDTITINLRALSEDVRNQIDNILDKQLNSVPDEMNEEALEILRNFEK
jgi:hypothetical protein